MSLISAMSLIIIIFLAFIGFGLTNNRSFAQVSDQNNSDSCISYESDEDSGKDVITISCLHPTNLTDNTTVFKFKMF